MHKVVHSSHNRQFISGPLSVAQSVDTASGVPFSNYRSGNPKGSSRIL